MSTQANIIQSPSSPHHSCQDGILILQHDQEAFSKKRFKERCRIFIFLYTKSYKKFVEFKDVDSVRCYPLKETN
jgi:hypothetical protein